MIVSTFPLYSALLDVVRRDTPVPPLMTVITDSIEVHPAWLVAPSDVLCVPDEETREAVLQQGVPARCVHVTGFPVSLAFTHSPSGPPRSPSVLYMPSTSTPHVEQTLQGLRALVQNGTRLTVVPGRHGSRLYHLLRRFADSLPGAPLEILSWTDDMPKLLQTHDLLICKAGGAILHEALAAQIPVIIDYVVPGQEEGNAELLTKHGVAVVSAGARATGELASRLLADQGAGCARMRECMKPLSVPDAAARVSQLVPGA